MIRLDKSAEGTEPTAAWAQIREGISSIATTTGDLAHAVAYGRAGLELARHNGDERTIGGLLSCLGSACLGDGIPTRARDYYEESLQIRRAMGDRTRTAMSLCVLGLCCVQLEEYERGEAYLRDAEQTLRGAGGGLQAAAIHCAFAELALATGDAGDAGGRLDSASELMVRSGAMTGVPGLLEQYACVAEMMGNAEKSVRLFLAAAGGRARLACPARPWEEDTRGPFRERAEIAVGVESLVVLVAEGRKMPLRRALRYAKGEG
ncbi:MAG: tetratricopeptide repeat protein [Robiginitomaculum sp.]|nr:tetratricopeptide repeat protein [Robiginitomaculum sp.]